MNFLDTTYPFETPPLTYEPHSLEPYIDTQTMKIHHDKHHAGYVAKLNTALKSHSDLTSKTLGDLLGAPETLPTDVQKTIINNGGGHANHSLFWTVLTSKTTTPSKKLSLALSEAFGDFDTFKRDFSLAASTLFGSGWTWLVVDSKHKLSIITTANQNSPLSQNMRPILGLDVWEHAYYLTYQNRRPDYIKAFFTIINWTAVSDYFALQ